MKHIKWAVLVAVCLVMAINLSCNRNVYDEAEYNRLIDSVSPVDSVDPNHNWVLYTTKTLIVTAPDTGNVKMIKILTANPRQTGDAEVVGEAYASDGEKVVMSVSYPSYVTKLYAAAVDSENNYTISEFSTSASSIVDFTNPVVVSQKVSYTPQPQIFTFCFEEEYPMPGDYDYNDVVLRVSQERTGEKEMRFHVELAAVGATIQLAGAIRLVNFKYSDIESVKTVDSLSFNTTNGNDIPDQMMYVSTNKDFLISGRNGEAVLNLFVDAHWATGDILDVNYGMMTRKKYNVSKNTSSSNQVMTPRTITYIVKFKDGSALNELSLGELDPFIVGDFNSARLETHLYTYRDAQVLYPYYSPSIKNLPWALGIPSGAFRWPLHGENIGFKMKEVIYGAYMNYGHSFGEWSMDRTLALDWYLYPQESKVF